MGSTSDVNLSVGILLPCVMLSSLFFGVLTVQVHFYFSKYMKDPWGIRGIVMVIWILTLLHQVLAAMWIYQFAIREYANEKPMMTPGWRIGAAAICMSLTTFIVEIFYTRRGYLLNKSLWALSLLTLLIAVLALAAGMIEGVYLLRHPYLNDLTPDRWLHKTWYSASVAADMLAVIIVVYTLRGAKTSAASTRKGIRNIIIYTISTGIVMTVFALAAIVTFTLIPNTFVTPGITMILTRIYSISLMTSLNLRGTWIKEKESTSLEAVPASAPAHFVGMRAVPRHNDRAKPFPTSSLTTSTSIGATLPPVGGVSEVDHAESVEVLRLEDMIADLGDSSSVLCDSGKQTSSNNVIIIGH